jgi:hypothetical protein
MPWLLACLVVGCGYFPQESPRAIKVKHKHNYTREQRFWAGETGDVQGWVLPLALVSPSKNKALRDATKDSYTFFVVTMHHKTSNEALTEEKVAPTIKLSVQNNMIANVDPSVVEPLIKDRINELTPEKNRLIREAAALVAEAAPAEKAAETNKQLAQVEGDLDLLMNVRAYLHPGHIETKRGLVWFQIVVMPGKEDLAAIQHVQWGYSEGGPVDMQEYGYKFEQLDKLKLKRVGQRKAPGWLPGYLKEWFEHFWL